MTGVVCGLFVEKMRDSVSPRVSHFVLFASLKQLKAMGFCPDGRVSGTYGDACCEFWGCMGPVQVPVSC